MCIRDRVSTALGRQFPKDRIGYATFQMDGVYSDFSYTKFYPEIAAATGEDKARLLNAKWVQDIANWKTELATQPNVGFYIPYARDLLDAHCLTVLTFGGTAIKEARQASVGAFVDNLIDGTSTPTRAFETQPIVQKTFGLLSYLINPLMDLLGV